MTIFAVGQKGEAMRLINADALMQEFAEFARDSNNSDFADVPAWNDAVSLLGSAPTIEERKKGEWIKTIKHYKDDNMEFDFYAIKCSACGEKPEKAYHLTRYCPNCGADMRSEEYV